MAVHDAKTTYGHCKNLIELFETLIDPIFPIVGSVVLEEPRGTYASRKQMIPASHLRIHKPKSSRSHRFISRSAEASIVLISQIIPQKQTLVNENACPLFVLFPRRVDHKTKLLSEQRGKRPPGRHLRNFSKDFLIWRLEDKDRNCQRYR
jgi:hypothetical protein